MSRLTFDDCLDRLDTLGCRPMMSSSSRAYFKCPLHDDSTASATLSHGKRNGYVVAYCLACCQPDYFMALLKFMQSGMQPGWRADRSRVLAVKNRTPIFVAECVYQYGPDLQKLRGHDADEDGLVLNRKSFRWQHRKQHVMGHSWQWCRECGHAVPLYGAGCIADAEWAVLYVVEGEKDCDAMREHGLLAVSAPYGAYPGAWQQRWSDALRDAENLSVIADNDRAGIDFACEVSRALSRTGRIAQVFIPVQPFKDVSDMFDSGSDFQIRPI